MSAPFLSRSDRFQRFQQLARRIREGGEDNDPENMLTLLYNGMNSEIFKAEAEIQRMRESNMQWPENWESYGRLSFR